MSKARIYSPPKSAMQSGQARTQGWVLRHVSDQPKRIDPLMGWTGSADTEQQVVLHFDTLEEAEDYARANGIDYDVEARRQVPAMKPKSYSDNFRWGRKQNWTH